MSNNSYDTVIECSAAEVVKDTREMIFTRKQIKHTFFVKRGNQYTRGKSLEANVYTDLYRTFQHYTVLYKPV